MNDPNNYSEEEQIEYVQEHYSNINVIRNPREEVQIAAVRSDRKALYYIDYPSEEVQIEVVRNWKYNLNQPNQLFVESFITSPKALELCEKLKITRNIIK
jgi:hypothetical protein